MAEQSIFRAAYNGIVGMLTPLPASEVGPIREASPSSPDAPPVEGVVSRTPERVLIPDVWLANLAANADTILAGGGKGLALYDELLDDGTAASNMQTRRLSIIERDWEVAPGDPDDPRSVQAADELRAMLKDLDWDRVTAGMHWAVWYGYGIGEGLFEHRTFEGRTIVWLTDIVIPDRRWFGFAQTGELRWAETFAPMGGQPLPENKFWTLRTGGTHDFAFYGVGLAHWCYWPIFFKRTVMQVWALYLDRFSSPTTVVGIEENDTQAQKDKLLRAASAIGTDSAAIVPREVLEKKLIQMFEPTRNAGQGASYKDFIETQDEELMRVILGQPGSSKATPQGIGGEQAAVHERVAKAIVKADSDVISASFHGTIARWLTTWNHGADVAAPTVYRVLDDAEDLNTVAERDVKLDGIGIRRTKESVAEVYGDGYELMERPTPADEAENAAKLAQAKAGAAPGAAGSNVVPFRKRAEFGANDPMPLYVSRKLLNGAELMRWAKDAGIPNLVDVGSLHVTVLYSKQPVDWMAMGSDDWSGDGTMNVAGGGPRRIERFGQNEDGPLVMMFASDRLRWRHDSMVERGASHDFPEYLSHITLSDDPGDFDWSKVEPFQGELRFGPEIFEPIKEADPLAHAFTARELTAINDAAAAMAQDANPIFAAIADSMRANLEGVTTIEGARVAILQAFEQMPLQKIAEHLGKAGLAVRAASLAGDPGAIVA